MCWAHEAGLEAICDCFQRGRSLRLYSTRLRHDASATPLPMLKRSIFSPLGASAVTISCPAIPALDGPPYTRLSGADYFACAYFAAEVERRSRMILCAGVEEASQASGRAVSPRMPCFTDEMIPFIFATLPIISLPVMPTPLLPPDANRCRLRPLYSIRAIATDVGQPARLSSTSRRC